MKSALCMYGKIGGDRGKDGLGNPIDYRECFNTIKRHIIDVNGCDVFLHCWNVECRDQLVNLYSPRKHLIEPQIKFNTVSTLWKEKKREFITKSRWYSNKETLRLKQEYENENGFVYDWIMVCRYDLLFFVDFDFTSLDQGYFYASNYNEWRPNAQGQRPKENKSLKESKYLDMWFVGSSEFMDKFGRLYDHFYEYALNNPHTTSWSYVKSFAGDPLKITRFMFYRWHDYELYRLKHGARL